MSQWETKTLGEISQLNSGGTPLKSTKAFWDGGDIPWYSSGELNDVYTNDPKKYITRAGLDSSNAKLFPKGSLLIGMYDTAALKTSILDRDATFNQAVAGMLPKNGANFRFLLYAIWHIRPEVLKLRRGVRQKNLSLAKIKAISVPYPAPAEQRRVVGLLDEAFAGIATAKANAEKNLQNARALFESHLNAVFTQRGDDEKCLADVCEFRSGGTPSKKNKSYWIGQIPWVSGRDMKSTQLSDTALHISQKAVDESSTRMAPTGSLLTLVRGMGLAHGAQITELMVPCAFNQDIRAIHPNRDVVPRYLLFALRTRINTSDNVMSNAAHGTMKIDMDELRNVRVPLPAVNRQREVVVQIDSLDEETQRLASIYQRKLAALDELKKSLLHQAFSGQL